VPRGYYQKFLLELVLSEVKEATRLDDLMRAPCWSTDCIFLLMILGHTLERRHQNERGSRVEDDGVSVGSCLRISYNFIMADGLSFWYLSSLRIFRADIIDNANEALYVIIQTSLFESKVFSFTAKLRNK